MSVAQPSPALDDGQLHAELLQLNQRRLDPALEVRRRVLEDQFLEASRAEIAARAASAPAEPDAFAAWFERLRDDGPGQRDPLLVWLAAEATLDQLRWFVRQELASEAGLDELVARTTADGGEPAARGAMRAWLAEALALDLASAPVCESVALGNLLAGLAYDRPHEGHAIGAIGATNLTAPDRARLVCLGLKRRHVAASARQAYLRYAMGGGRAAAWSHEWIAARVREQPACAAAIAEGALMRLRAGERCFVRYRRELGLDTGSVA